MWAGLGYYSRARNLHRAARLCVERHGGELPDEFEALAALPGIGRSTAGAILAQAHGTRLPILDGNVRRVLARHAGIDGDVQAAGTQRALWALAESLLPHARLAEYTQAIMDLGATVCRRADPRCGACPVAADCVALREGRTAELPRRKAPRALATRETMMLVLRDGAGRQLLQRRPPSGIWGGLWSLPECAPGTDVAALLAQEFGLRARTTRALPPFVHVFTHFRLRATPRVHRDRRHAHAGRRLRQPALGRRRRARCAGPAAAGAPPAQPVEGGCAMTRMVNCVRLGREAEGLAFAPWPGELGRRVYENVSKQAWAEWVARQTMLINENRLSPLDPKHRAFLETEMRKFLFEGGSEAPAGYVPPPA